MKIVFSTIWPISDKADLKVKPKRIEAKDRLVKETGTFENEEIENATIENVLRIGPGYAEKRIEGGDDIEDVLEDVGKDEHLFDLRSDVNCKFCVQRIN